MSVLTCASCGRAGRKSHHPAALHPGTLALVAAGMCARCYRGDIAPTPPVQEVRPNIETIHADLAEFLHNRRRRLAKTRGINA